MNTRRDYHHAQHCAPFESLTYGDAAGPAAAAANESPRPMASRDNLFFFFHTVRVAEAGEVEEPAAYHVGRHQALVTILERAVCV